MVLRDENQAIPVGAFPKRLLLEQDKFAELETAAIEHIRSGKCMAIGLSPKCGKTSVLKRVMPPLLHEAYKERDVPLQIAFVNCTSLNPRSGYSEDEYYTKIVSGFNKLLQEELEQLLPGRDLSSDNLQPLEHLMKLLNMGRYVGGAQGELVLLVDEFQVFAQCPNGEGVGHVMDSFKTALQDHCLRLIYSGSGMVEALSSILHSTGLDRTLLERTVVMPLDRPSPTDEEDTVQLFNFVWDGYCEVFSTAKAKLIAGFKSYLKKAGKKVETKYIENAARDMLLLELGQKVELSAASISWMVDDLYNEGFDVTAIGERLAEKLVVELARDCKALVNIAEPIVRVSLHKLARGEVSTEEDAWNSYGGPFVPFMKGAIVDFGQSGMQSLLNPYKFLVLQAWDENGVVNPDFLVSRVTLNSHLVSELALELRRAEVVFAGDDNRLLLLNLRLLGVLRYQYSAKLESSTDWEAWNIAQFLSNTDEEFAGNLADPGHLESMPWFFLCAVHRILARQDIGAVELDASLSSPRSVGSHIVKTLIKEVRAWCWSPRQYLCFISHARKDAKAAAVVLKRTMLGLCDQEGQPEHVFRDVDDLGGQQLDNLEHFVRLSGALVVLLTKHFLERPACVREIVAAYQYSVPMVSVSIPGSGEKDDVEFKDFPPGDGGDGDEKYWKKKRKGFAAMFKSQDTLVDYAVEASRQLLTECAIPLHYVGKDVDIDNDAGSILATVRQRLVD